ncbi:MAG: penicillin acylase family protein, partial [Marinoscillum sp.]
ILNNWDRTSQPDNLGAAQFLVIYDFLRGKYKASYTGERYVLKTEEAVEAISAAHKYLMKHFKRVDIRLSDYQFLVRGSREVPVAGIPDVITAMHSLPYKDGKVRAVQGESLIMLIRYPEEGLPIIETVNVYGSSNQPDSPHYDDQMNLFLNKERKPMTLDIDEVRRTAESIYHPVKK